MGKKLEIFLRKKSRVKVLCGLEVKGIRLN
jgi:hypothetical protein